ncbi:MAG TPA: hypothetical protein VHK24_12925 [Steroidobacter sp.]|nr:hypothetical protein [Steroidobacter sp.]
MTVRLALTAVLCASAASASADELKIIELEQDVRTLERQVETLNRQVSELRAQLSRTGERLPSRTDPSLTLSTEWLVAANWDRVRAGMSEFDVISTLGPPISMRVENDKRVLLYAMEIGTGGFLSGRVILKDRQVVEVEKPVLK